MPNAEKTAAVAEITEHFKSSSAAVVTEYRGLTVKQMSELRRALGRDTTYAVVKNTLTKRAATEAGVEIDESLLVGPTAIAFISGDPVDAAKGLRDFAKANPVLVVKGGVMEGKTLSASEVSRIADLESREVLLAKLAGALVALPTRAAGLFQAPLSQMARLAAALQDKKPADAGASDAAGDTDGGDLTAAAASVPESDDPSTDTEAAKADVPTAGEQDTPELGDPAAVDGGAVEAGGGEIS
ncbi:50S ribosomal protein L10 [Jatrophihabitans sp. YIM 134969]